MSEVKRRLMVWAVGPDRRARDEGPRPDTAVVVVEDARHARALAAAGTVGATSTVFAPEPAPVGDVTAQVVPYGGSAWRAGSEFRLGAVFLLQNQRYAVSEYLSVIGPTVVRIGDAEDLEVFLDDADRAHATGRFPAFLTNPLVHLADLPAIGGPSAPAEPEQRLHVRGDGSVSTSPAGLPLGHVDDPLPDLVRAWADRNAGSRRPDAVALGAVVDDHLRVEALDRRPWLGRYVAALDALRHAAVRGRTGLRVSGFGDHLAAVEVAGDGAAAPTGPLVAYDDEVALVHDADRGRTLRMDLAVGRLVDLLLRCGSVQEAAASGPPVAVLEQVEARLARHGILVAPRTAGVGA